MHFNFKSIVSAALLLLIATQAEASPDNGTVTKSWTQVAHVVKYVNLNVDTDPPLVLGIWEARGVAMFPDNEVAQLEMAATSETSKTGITSSAYMFYNFDDGSKQSLKLIAKSSAPSEDAGMTHAGTIKFLSGSGRFAGIKGKGRFTATQHDQTMIFKIEATYLVTGKSAPERLVQKP